jgi:hypothetical protein
MIGLSFAQKEIGGRLESGTETGEDEEDESGWRAKKKTAVSRENVPADGSSPA